MGKLKSLVAVAAIICSPAIATEHEPITLEGYTKELQKLQQGKNTPPNSIVNSAELYGTNPDGEKFYFAAGMGVTVLATQPAPETPCMFPPIYSRWVGSFWFVWCASPNVSPFQNYEAKRDTYISFGGRPPVYFVSSHYDCQNSSDYAAMPPVVRAALCP